MRLWLDDVRPPWRHGCLGWDWVTTAAEAIAALATGTVTEASLDHDLTEYGTVGLTHHCQGCNAYLATAELGTRRSTATGQDVPVCPRCGSYSVAEEPNGMQVLKWLEAHPEHWPPEGIRVHSLNPDRAPVMRLVVRQHYGRNFEGVHGSSP
jgi:hypothetical protein